MTLYHVTWGQYVESILASGLIPNFHPSRWKFAAARERSQGKLFLCTADRRPYWQMNYEEGWVDPPEGPFQLVWLEIDAAGLDLSPDVADNGVDDYTGDFWFAGPIPADRIKVLETLDGDA